MAADGSRGPKPWTVHRVSTTFLRVPRKEWPAVKIGAKREFRAGHGAKSVPQLWGVEPPTVVVAYSIDELGRHDHRLMVLEDRWTEPLGAISQESLLLEGFDDLAGFRRHWMERERRRFRPTRMVSVYRVRPADRADIDELGPRLVERLYGDFIEDLA